MKLPRLNFLKSHRAREIKSPASRGGFTLIELLVVIAIIAILAAILLPVLASAKIRAQRAECMNNMKQLAAGIIIFDGDHNDTYPPAGWDNGGSLQVSWDSLIYSYIGGGNNPANTLDAGVYANDPDSAAALGIAAGLKIMACPFDNLPKINWMTTTSGSQLNCAVKDNEMVSSGEIGRAHV